MFHILAAPDRKAQDTISAVAVILEQGGLLKLALFVAQLFIGPSKRVPVA